MDEEIRMRIAEKAEKESEKQTRKKRSNEIRSKWNLHKTQAAITFPTQTFARLNFENGSLFFIFVDSIAIINVDGAGFLA